MRFHAKTRARFVDRDAPLREAVELVKEMKEDMVVQCEDCGPGSSCKNTECGAYKTMKKAEAFLKKHGGEAHV